ncbi:MAG: trimethylamine methyltransferase family protein [Deltaproteobacteria bacterium]|nr:trimethylamine methyltransferase family protein [Deltaproteobacteria bacterium]
MKKIGSCYKVLSDEQIVKVHEKSVAILEKIGVKIDSEKARRIYRKNGCKVKGDRVHIPAQLVNELTSIKQDPLTIYSRTGQSVTLERGKTYYHNCGTVASILDSGSGELRNAAGKDAVDLTRLLDALGSVDTITPIVYPQDIDQRVALLFSLKETLKNTTKPIGGPGVNNLPEAEYMLEMLSVFNSDDYKLQGCFKISPISPLSIPKHSAEALIFLVEKKCPVGALPCPIVGLTAPMSLLGAITQQNAEVLAILTLARSIDINQKLTYGARLVVPNLAFCNTLGGSPENTIVDVCAVQMAHFYNMVSDIYGEGTCSILPDAQMGFEKGIKGTISTLAGAMWQSGIGSVNDGFAVSYEQVVIDDEIIKNIYHSLLSLAEDEDNMGFDAVNDVAEGRSDYISHNSTLQFMKSPEMYNRQMSVCMDKDYKSWKNSGMVSIQTRAREKVETILKKHLPAPVDKEQKKALEKIFEHAAGLGS